MSASKKPFGVTLVAPCSGFFGLMAVPTGCAATFARQVPGVSLYFMVTGLIAIIVGVLLLAGSHGVWTLQEWGRNLMLWLRAISIPLGIISIFPIWPGQKMTIGNAVLQIVGVAVNVLIVLYLIKPGVKTLFWQDQFARATARKRKAGTVLEKRRKRIKSGEGSRIESQASNGDGGNLASCG